MILVFCLSSMAPSGPRSPVLQIMKTTTTLDSNASKHAKSIALVHIAAGLYVTDRVAEEALQLQAVEPVVETELPNASGNIESTANNDFIAAANMEVDIDGREPPPEASAHRGNDCRGQLSTRP